MARKKRRVRDAAASRRKLLSTLRSRAMQERERRPQPIACSQASRLSGGGAGRKQRLPATRLRIREIPQNHGRRVAGNYISRFIRLFMTFRTAAVFGEGSWRADRSRHRDRSPSGGCESRSPPRSRCVFPHKEKPASVRTATTTLKAWGCNAAGSRLPAVAIEPSPAVERELFPLLAGFRGNPQRQDHANLAIARNAE